MHDNNIKSKDNISLKYYLEENILPMPYNYDKDKMTIFDKACYGIIPNSIGHE